MTSILPFVAQDDLNAIIDREIDDRERDRERAAELEMIADRGMIDLNLERIRTGLIDDFNTGE